MANKFFFVAALLALAAVSAAGCGGGTGNNGQQINPGSDAGTDAGTNGGDAGTGTDAGVGCNPPCGAGQTCTAGKCTGGSPTTLAAQSVGAYQEIGTTCSSGTDWQGYAFFLCPGGRLRGAGTLGSVTELLCGSYQATPPSLSNCTDKIGCFPKAQATAKQTLILGGQTDVTPSFSFYMLMMKSSTGKAQLWRPAGCKDNSSGWIVLQSIAADVSSDYCVSSACPNPGGSSSATCGTDCDCGRCWYCDKSSGTGTCRYGGEGPYGCYRGCG